MGLGALAFLYVVFTASSKPEPAGLARFAEASLQRLTVLDDPPPQPANALTDAEGGEVRLSDMEGDLLVVNLWATWCPPCIAEMPTLGALQERFADRGVRVVAVSVDELAKTEEAKAALARLSEGRLDFYQDYTRAILFSSRAPGMPTTILYDRHGRELARVAGEADWSSEEGAALIEAALTGG